MKDNDIKIRVPNNLKKELVMVVEQNKTNVSEVIRKLIEDYIREYRVSTMEFELQTQLISMGISNVEFIRNSHKVIPKLRMFENYVESVNEFYETVTYKGDFIEFALENIDKRIYLYLMGSDINNGVFRVFTL